MMVLLFDADSVVNNDILRKRPAYVTKTNGQGRFEFKYLRNSPYKVFGLSDTDKSNTYSQLTEKIALSEDSVITFSIDSLQTDSIQIENPLSDSVSVDSISTDSLAIDSISIDSILTDSALVDSITADSLDIDSTITDSHYIDSTGTDSLLIDSTVADSLIEQTAFRLIALQRIVF